MNERIEALKEQAFAETDMRVSVLDKFAELIVAECVRLLVTGEGNEKTTDAIWDLEELGVDVSKLLAQIRS